MPQRAKYARCRYTSEAPRRSRSAKNLRATGGAAGRAPAPCSPMRDRYFCNPISKSAHFKILREVPRCECAEVLATFVLAASSPGHGMDHGPGRGPPACRLTPESDTSESHARRSSSSPPRTTPPPTPPAVGGGVSDQPVVTHRPGGGVSDQPNDIDASHVWVGARRPR